MTAQYEPGERVRIGIDAEVVAAGDPSLEVVYRGGDGQAYALYLRSDAPALTVERVAPKEWPPQVDDVWRAANGTKYWADGYSAHSGMDEPRMVGGGRGFWPDELLAEAGPLTLVYREGWSPAPAEPADDQAEVQPSYADSLRELADWLDAHPDMPMPLYSLHVSGSLVALAGPAASVERVRRAGELLGVAVQDELGDATGKRHLRTEREFGRVQFSLSFVTDAAPAAAGGSSPALAGPPATENSTEDADGDPALPADEFTGVHERVGGRAGGPADCAAWCACGVTFAGFDTIAEAGALVDGHAARANRRTAPPTDEELHAAIASDQVLSALVAALATDDGSDAHTEARGSLGGHNAAEDGRP